jgi:hypothetical protein
MSARTSAVINLVVVLVFIGGVLLAAKLYDTLSFGALWPAFLGMFGIMALVSAPKRFSGFGVFMIGWSALWLYANLSTATSFGKLWPAVFIVAAVGVVFQFMVNRL